MLLKLFQNSFTSIKKYFMGNLLYTIAVILVIIWAIGFIGYGTGGIIHLLLVIAIIVVLLRVIQGRKPL
jgi:type IV secretory pathway VirB2 component (pilin)